MQLLALGALRQVKMILVYYPLLLMGLSSFLLFQFPPPPANSSSSQIICFGGNSGRVVDIAAFQAVVSCS